MFRGFILDTSENFFTHSYEIGQRIRVENNRMMEANLKLFVNPDGTIDAGRLKREWFPDVSVDVFISHSHSDLDLAISFAGWLKNHFGISSFIDSTAWKFADDLLSEIDNKNCYDKISNTFDYQKRNITTSNVHMILANALTVMIDKTECFFFIKSENSILPESVTDKTHSPWLFHELEIARMIRKKSPAQHRQTTKLFTKAERNELNEAAKFIFDLDLSNFPPVKIPQLNSWFKTHMKNQANALDTLYSLIPLNSNY